MALLSPCNNCKKVNCLKGEPLTTAWEGLKVYQTYPKCSAQNKGSIVRRYSKDGFTKYNQSTGRDDKGRLLVQGYSDRYECLYTSLEGFVYDC